MAQVIRRRQATVREGVTAAVLTSWFPAALGEAVPDLLRKTRLAEEINGYAPAWGEDWVSARPPTSAEAREFSIKRGSPVVVVHSRRFDADDAVWSTPSSPPGPTPASSTATPSAHSSAPFTVIPGQVQVTEANQSCIVTKPE